MAFTWIKASNWTYGLGFRLWVRVRVRVYVQDKVKAMGLGSG
jgi:hypothetical protein